MSARFASYAPKMLSILRIMAALIFLEHGTQKILGFPPGGPVPLPSPLTMLWWAGMIEMVPGFLLATGLFTRTAAFLAAGEMAFAYWIGHAPRAFWPVDNEGDAAILYCFIFLFILCAGAGPWSLDAIIARRRPPAGNEEG
jgi:putative oxidoreductase